MQIDCKIVLKDLNGAPMTFEGKPFTVGIALSRLIMLTKVKSFDNLKRYVLAMKFNSDDYAEVDIADLDVIKEVLAKEQEVFGAIVTGQIHTMLTK